MTPKHRILVVFPILLLSTAIIGRADSNRVRPEEMEDAARWIRIHLDGAASPFSFLYGEKPSSELLPQWKREKTVRKIDDRRTGHTVTWHDPATDLTVQCDAVEYRDFPTVEWVVRFKNTGKADTPILSDIRSVDISMESAAADKNVGPSQSGIRDEYVLHHSKGSRFARDEFLPLEDTLRPGDSKTVATEGGRPSRGALPYFNVRRKTGGGRIVALGWPGQWSARFENDKASGMRIRGGQERTHFKLLPGEEVRTPMTVLQFWHGNDRVRSHNIWRRWMLAFGTPQKDGKPVPPHFAACSSHQYNEMINATDRSQIEMIDRYLAEGIKLDYWWMDAGWYVMKNTNSWPETGTWEVDRKRFPEGLRKVSDHAHSKGVGIILWFEPERVHSGTWLTENHPDWIFGGKDGGLLDLGNPAAWSWLVDHVDRILTEEKIDFYRQDFNTDPLDRWQSNDAPDRQGITEIKHVTGYLAYWDELLRRHPGLRIDTCASGGNRLDLETLRRSVPLLRSDWIFDPSANQNHTQSLSFWIPLFGTGETLSAHSDLFPGRTGGVEPYRSRSALVPFINSCTDMRTPADSASNRTGSADYPNMKRYFADWQRCAEYFYGDYYPLMPYSLDESSWIAWQFDLPGAERGMIQIFRREGSSYEAARFPLHGLDPEAKYDVEDIDRGPIGTFSGKELLEKGIRFETDRKPDAGILFYRRIP